MTLPYASLYHGLVTHRRLAPLRHSLRYRVFNLLLDVDALDSLNLRWLSHNRWNLFSIHDSDHCSGEAKPLMPQLQDLVAKSADGNAVTRIFMFCYPRVLGYGFNPLTVYFCYEAGGALTHVIYEVNNTSGDRNSYVIPVEGSGTIHQECNKVLYVSPFNAVEGRYSFHIKPPGDDIVIGVALHNSLGPSLKAYISGERLALSNKNLLRMFLAFPLMTQKIITAIHWQALKLWFKGLKLKTRPLPPSPAYSISDSAHDHE